VAALLAGLTLWRIDFPQMLEKLISTGSTGVVPGRLEMWSRALYMLQDFPFTGIGMGAYQDVANALYPFFLLGPDANAPHAHNLFLQVGVDLGIPGLVAWLGLLLLVAFSAWRVYRLGRRQGIGWVAGIGAGLLCSQIALVIHGMFDAAVWGADSAILVWAIWGICMAAYNLRHTYGPD
jgi:putative inorganic carbon (HCO3(-)) transporter